MNEIELKADEIAREKYFPLDNEDNTEYYNCYCSAMEMYDFAVEKAVKWLEEQDFGGWIESPTDELIDEFKKYMQDD